MRVPMGASSVVASIPVSAAIARDVRKAFIVFSLGFRSLRTLQVGVGGAAHLQLSIPSNRENYSLSTSPRSKHDINMTRKPGVVGCWSAQSHIRTGSRTGRGEHAD